MESKGLKNFSRVETLCSTIDELASDLNPLVSEYGLQPGTDNYLFIKLLCDALTIRAHILHQILEIEKAERIVVFCNHRTDQLSAVDVSLPFHSKENIFGILLGLEGWECEVDIINEAADQKSDSRQVPLRQTPNHKNPAAKRVLQKVSKHPALLDTLDCTRKRGVGSGAAVALHAMHNALRARKALLMVGFTYNWHYILPELYRDGYSIAHLTLPEIVQTHASEASFPNTKEILQRSLTLENIDLSPVFKTRFLPLLKRYFSELPELIKHMNTVISEVQPRAVLFGTKSNYRENIIAHIAHHHHVPVLSWQHGTQGLHYSLIALYNEYLNSDYHLCFGEGVIQTFKADMKTRSKTQLAPIGSFELEDIFFNAGGGSQDYQALYVTAPYKNNNLYVGSSSLRTDNELWATQKRILDILGRLNVKTIFKLHPSQCNDEHIRDFLTERGYVNIRPIKREASYVDLLAKAPCVILDSPTTTLLQALAAKKTIFAYQGHIRFTEYARSLLDKRAYVGDDLDEFTGLLAKYFTGEPLGQHPNIEDTDLLEEYGVQKLDRQVIGRALALLRSIA